MSLAGRTQGYDSHGEPPAARRHERPVRRIAIAAGGTAGHVTAGLAVAEAYRAEFDDVSVCFIGTEQGLESRMIPDAGHELELVAGTPLAGETFGGKLKAVWNMGVGAVQARRVLSRSGARLVIGFGGYASSGALLAARSLGLRIAIHESNVVLGMTNRLLGRLADRTYLGFESTARENSEARVTGNPVRGEITECAARKAERSADWDRPARVAVLGGSLGSKFLNARAADLLGRVAELGAGVEVRHQAGDVDLDSIRRTYAQAGVTANVTPFISDMGEVYRWADFAVTSAGALTLAELAASGLPALLIPLRGSAGDHQVANARAFAGATGGWWVAEQDWDAETLAPRVASLLLGVEEWESASKRVRELATPGAARAMVQDCEELMSGQW
jgi:UDP-N-acetylglucosamine--N-acetylmuramyl-(pentapeptide) pyrophosphoryl-undecaprenol N-acetylglucosamine transferase